MHINCALKKPPIGTPFSCCRITTPHTWNQLFSWISQLTKSVTSASVTVRNELSEALPMRSRDFNPPFAMLKWNCPRMRRNFRTSSATYFTAHRILPLSSSQYALSMSLSQRPKQAGLCLLMYKCASRTPSMLGVSQKGKQICISRRSTLKQQPTVCDVRLRGCPLCVISRR